MTDKEPLRIDRPRSYYEIFEDYYLESVSKIFVLICFGTLLWIGHPDLEVNYYGLPPLFVQSMAVFAFLSWLGISRGWHDR